MPSPVDHGDVQGLVRFGFEKMTEACYFLLNIRNAPVARAWFRSAPITTAVQMDPPPETALQIAFTYPGLEVLKVPSNVLTGFSTEFMCGMAGDQNRSRRLGDTGTNSPSRWRWGGPGAVPHLVVMMFANAPLLEEWKRSVMGDLWSTAFDEIECLPTSDMGGREPFGFIDGVSQPDIDWDQARKVPINGDQIQYENVVCLGEFLLGYSNEYGRFTDRPLLNPQDPHSEDLLHAADNSEKKDLALNGSYLVIRQLEQDVRAFWQFVDKVSSSNPDARYKLAQAFVGRNLLDGKPLVPLSQTPIPGVGRSENEGRRQLDIERNLFTYDLDPSGALCPLGAHIRRGNPRNADVPGSPKGVISHLIRLLGFGESDPRADLIASTRFHRLLRRGREYGSPLSPEQALEPAPPGDSERGLNFVAVNSNIERQFEFVQNAWMMRTKFDGLTEESDPLLGNREAVHGCPFTNAFSLTQDDGVRRRIVDMPRFVTVRGGAYFFLPSMRALRYLSKIDD